MCDSDAFVPQQRFDVALATDSQYVRHAAVAIASLTRFSYSIAPTIWLVTDSDLSPRDKLILQRASGSARQINIVYHRPDRIWGTATRKESRHVSEAMYLRLAIPDLLPSKIEKVLYVDCDTLCTSPTLLDLFQLDISTKCLAAAIDAFTPTVAANGAIPGLEHYPEIPREAPYFNSGVLLINVTEWRKRQVRIRAEEYLNTVQERRFPDQDALNVAVYRHWKQIGKRWNHMKSWRLESDYPKPEGTLDDVTLIHSAGSLKFWDLDFPQGTRKKLYFTLANELHVE